MKQGQQQRQKQKRIVVVVRCADRTRASEALRAAVGLTLRGDHVEVVWATDLDRSAPAYARALSTLATLGHLTEGRLAPSTLVDADAVEVWT